MQYRDHNNFSVEEYRQYILILRFSRDLNNQVLIPLRTNAKMFLTSEFLLSVYTLDQITVLL